MARSLPGSIKGFTMASMLCMSMSLNSVFPGVHSNAIGVALARRSTWFARGAPSYGARTSSVVSKPLSVSKHVVGKDRVPAYTVCGAKPNKGSSEEFNSTPIEGVYVLMLSNRTYYVGKSVNIPERVKQHMSGKGASCVRGPVTRISPITPRQCDLESWERTETLTRMYKYGICKVRGWMYTSQTLSVEQQEHAFGQICEKFDLCRSCGSDSHFASCCHCLTKAAWFAKGR